MFEVLLLAQLSCPHLSNYAITSGGDCINLSPVFHSDSDNGNGSEGFIADELGIEPEELAFEDEFISAHIKSTGFYSFFVYVTNNHPSRRIIPTSVTYELLDSNAIPFYTSTYSTGENSGSVIGIAPGKEAPVSVVNDDEARREYRTLLRDNYSVNVLSIGYDLGYEMSR